MKILFTAGGTGGHFYPLIAIAEAIRDVVTEQKILPPTLYYLADKPYDEEALFANDIIFLQAPAGKIRRYASFSNVTDLFVTVAGVVKAFFILLKVYPDVIISKGGYASVPTVIAASLLRIPLIAHESDARPGRANLLAAKSAVRIGVAFESAREAFPKKYQYKIAKTGIPVRKTLLQKVSRAEGIQKLGLDPLIPTVFIVGGSSGSLRINETVLDALPDLVSFANVVHQTGKTHFESTRQTASVILGKNPHKDRYHPYPYLNADTLTHAAGAADVVIARAGSTSITEISLWGKPSVLIPIPESISHDQRMNAYTYAHTGAAVVLEEGNLTPHVLASEAKRISTDTGVAGRMSALAAGFANPDAARILAEEALRIALSHEKN
ncbi:UDP-N-acetylglucosamine--N-acetylmuramyl-(pentapeptide) pyrophosphoryl-undecaprenol N-acetylglucosamine transferase [Patescibacteria group bacterium]|nr:UDP-N-acetylglucosamine--N-acetylmuramyl-(pentapeptide) pyrophosphoryl-undecaprenol N-acetylglucosamine transferase [Patescibacteria group bacterium]MBU1500949.1 UDP-N-acetylglucosamine--N-acetylmuramyl-(pentapeptide) pyrophosphoryl-undecaprenol N-acetylglucosamine transferase [Patescibacteria group bacterium]MBU2080579.1 UDP-N-acetylglucosamine--N-acetylmuramyl-(pentapeptide) pyrophosphoryl-undecaprenol N-acetylglucosamine transferase [Patescibacteria group bacterium]MBU2124345.1 UDP-N-acety